MKGRLSCHLRMSVSVTGQTTHVEAFIALNRGGAVDRFTLTDFSSVLDGSTGDGYDSGVAALVVTRRLMDRVSDELLLRGCEFTVLQIKNALRDSWKAKAFCLLQKSDAGVFAQVADGRGIHLNGRSL